MCLQPDVTVCLAFLGGRDKVSRTTIVNTAGRFAAQAIATRAVSTADSTATYLPDATLPHMTYLLIIWRKSPLPQNCSLLLIEILSSRFCGGVDLLKLIIRTFC